jgi:hypothetical protein
MTEMEEEEEESEDEEFDMMAYKFYGTDKKPKDHTAPTAPWNQPTYCHCRHIQSIGLAFFRFHRVRTVPAQSFQPYRHTAARSQQFHHDGLQSLSRRIGCQSRTHQGH